MRDRKLEELIEQIEKLTLQQAEQRDTNRELQRNQENLERENRSLRARVASLEATRSTRAGSVAGSQNTRQIAWPRVGDRVRIHSPTLPTRYHRTFFVPEDRLATVLRLDSRFVYVRTDSGIDRHREPQNLDIIKRAEDNIN